MTALEALGAYVAEGDAEALPADVHTLLRLHAADTVGAWVAGAGTAEGRLLRAYRDVLARECSGAALEMSAGCAVTRLSELDDIHIASMITPGSIVVPAALAIAAQTGAEAPSVNRAMLAGYDVMVRLGLAADGPAILYRGIWPTYFCAAPGVAAVASRLLGLDAAQSAHALALAVTLSAPGVGQQHAATMSRWLAAGHAARTGWQAAQAARSGFTSDLSLFENGYFRSLYDIAPNVAALTDRLGAHAMLRDVSFKPWSAARQTMASTQAFREMLAAGMRAADIAAVEVSVPPSFLRMVDHGIGDRMSRLTSVPFQIAIAALDPAAAYSVGQHEAVPPAVSDFMTKVKVSADETLLAGFPKVWRSRVRVQAGGAWHEREIDRVPGDPARPFDEVAVRDKFRRTSGEAIGADACDRLIDAVLATIDGKASAAQLLERIGAALPR